jgi:hypothetical protein
MFSRAAALPKCSSSASATKQRSCDSSNIYAQTISLRVSTYRADYEGASLTGSGSNCVIAPRSFATVSRRSPMRRTKQVLTVRFRAGVRTRMIARERGVAPSPVCEYLSRGSAAGIVWRFAADVTDERLMARLFVIAGVRTVARYNADRGNAHCGRLPFCQLLRPALSHIDAAGGRPPQRRRNRDPARTGRCARPYRAPGRARGTQWMRLLVPPRMNMDRKRWACRADLNRCICRSRRRVVSVGVTPRPDCSDNGFAGARRWVGSHVWLRRSCIMQAA